MHKFKVSLIITTYNWPEALFLVLKSVKNQFTMPDEIIVADDGSNKETASLIKKFSKEFKLRIIHSWQEDEGFRAAMSRNKAIAKAKGDYIIMIDGDMILHPNFVKDHTCFAKKNSFVQGMRAKLSEQKSSEIMKTKDIHFKNFDKGLKSKRYGIKNTFLASIFSGTCYINKLNMLQTCNMAFYKNDALKINGFNEDFIGWGREDSEFGARMLNSKIARRDLRFSAVAYHIHHQGNSRKMLDHNHKIYLNTLEKKLVRCKNGIDKYI
jgi:glycosyltransferase involved in cell wall biosynthesis